MEKILLIDFYNLMHRAYHAFPKELKNSKGTKTNAIYGFTNVLVTTFLNLKPTHILVAGETDRSFRQKEFSAYKENRTWRKDHPQDALEFDAQVPLAEEILKAFNIPLVKMENFEADDIIGSVSKDSRFNPQGLILILSSDQDFLQLVNSRVNILRPARPPYIKEKLFDLHEVVKTFGFEPQYIPDYKALRGDPSDNVPGVKGVGEKTAKSLIQKYKTIDEVYQNIDEIKPESLKQKLVAEKDMAYLSKRLATIVTNLEIKISPNEARVLNLLNPKAEELLKELEFYSILKKLTPNQKAKSKKEVEIDERQLGLF